MSPTELSLKLLREEGYLVEVVEKWIPGANIRKDLFGFIDMVAIKKGETLAVQCTSYSHVAERINKITDSENILTVREANWRVEVHGWGKEKNRWKLKRRVDLS